MSEATRLMQALLGPGASALEAQNALELALLSEVDPMHWCAAQLGVSDAEIMRRAASCIDLAYFDEVPRGATVKIAPRRLEMLGEVRLYRLRLLDREVAFAAPDFFGVLRLAQTRQVRPERFRDLYLVPPSALRAFMVHHAGEALLDGARQTMTRHWPHAAAQLDLTSPVRKGFAIALVVLTTLLILAPILGQGWLAPLWIGLVLLPTVLRLAALAMPPEPVLRTDTHEDGSSLPVYSVLVPLRDEANMVGQLFATLGQIDYPALCIKRTNKSIAIGG